MRNNYGRSGVLLPKKRIKARIRFKEGKRERDRQWSSYCLNRDLWYSRMSTLSECCHWRQPNRLWVWLWGEDAFNQDMVWFDGQLACFLSYTASHCSGSPLVCCIQCGSLIPHFGIAFIDHSSKRKVNSRTQNKGFLRLTTTSAIDQMAQLGLQARSVNCIAIMHHMRIVCISELFTFLHCNWYKNFKPFNSMFVVHVL